MLTLKAWMMKKQVDGTSRTFRVNPKWYDTLLNCVSVVLLWLQVFALFFCHIILSDVAFGKSFYISWSVLLLVVLLLWVLERNLQWVNLPFGLDDKRRLKLYPMVNTVLGIMRFIFVSTMLRDFFDQFIPERVARYNWLFLILLIVLLLSVLAVYIVLIFRKLRQLPEE